MKLPTMFRSKEVARTATDLLWESIWLYCRLPEVPPQRDDLVNRCTGRWQFRARVAAFWQRKHDEAAARAEEKRLSQTLDRMTDMRLRTRQVRGWSNGR